MRRMREYGEVELGGSGETGEISRATWRACMG